MNYTSANAKLTGRNRERRKLGNNTWLERRGEDIAVRLHNTDVLTFHSDNSTTLDSGGWRTVTTKARMNEYLEGFGISQKRGQWYVVGYNPFEQLAVYVDGMTIRADGTLAGAESLDSVKEAMKVRRAAQKYAKGYVSALFAGEVSAPGAGDCFYCQMKEVKTGKPLGEVTHDHSHILSHIEEKYYVPSLLANAFEAMPVSQVMRWAVAEKWYPEQMRNAGSNGHSFADDYTREAIQKTISRYVVRQLGQAS